MIATLHITFTIEDTRKNNDLMNYLSSDDFRPRRQRRSEADTRSDWSRLSSSFSSWALTAAGTGLKQRNRALANQKTIVTDIDQSEANIG